MNVLSEIFKVIIDAISLNEYAIIKIIYIRALLLEEQCFLLCMCDSQGLYCDDLQ